MLNAQATTYDIHSFIKEFYEAACGFPPAQCYEIVAQAKRKWLSTFNLPAIEDYKKDQLIKSEQLEEELRTVKNDIPKKAKAMVDLWSYRDGLTGLKNDNGTTINIGLDLSDNDIVDGVTPVKVVDIDE